MSLKLPIQLAVEFRGVTAASAFTRRDNGEVVNVPPKYKFEVESGNGDDVELLALSESVLERSQPDFPLASLQRGERLYLRGLVVLQDRGSDRDSYFQVSSIDRAEV